MSYEIKGNSLIFRIPTRYFEPYKELYKTTDHDKLREHGIFIIGQDYEQLSLHIVEIQFAQKVSIKFHIYNSPTQVSSIHSLANSIDECFKIAYQCAYKEFSYYKDK